MKIKNTYLLFVTIFGLISLAMYTTYAMFTASLDIGGFVDLTASNLPTDTSVIEYERLTLSAGESKIIDLNITNSTASSLYYGVWYEMVEPSSINNDIVVAKLDTSASETIGQLTSNTSNVVTLIIENNTTDSIVINIGVGYSQTSSLNLPTNRNIITEVGSEGIDMSDVVIPEPVDFDYSGSAKTYNVAATGKYKLEVWGAQGGYRVVTNGSRGGNGGYSYGTINLNEGDTLYVYVGGQGSVSAGSSTTRSGAGFNANSSSVANSATAANYGGGGGGASDIRLDINKDGTGTLYERVIVAGGGGGRCGYTTAVYCAGGVGGGETGGRGVYQASTTTNTTYSGQGGTQTAGGARGTYTTYGAAQAGGFGYGGYGGVRGTSTSYTGSGAGGGGWYGGGGGAYRYAGGGGGSGFVLTSSTKANVPSGYLITNTSYYLEDAATVAGSSSFTSPTGSSETGHSGNGYARISYISTLPSLNGLTDLSISPGTSYDLLSDVTCVDNGSGCTLVKASISDTSTLAEGEYQIIYTIKDNNNVKYKYKRNLKIVNNLDTSGANSPDLVDGMIPVMYNGSQWVKADSGNGNSAYQWYDYTNKQWANAVLVSSTNRSKYQNANPGTTISESDVLAYYVWIPRYKYKVWNINKVMGTDSYNAEINGIDIVFEKEKATTGTIRCNNYSFASPTATTPNETCSGANGDYYTHPAFTFGNTELRGLWISKFEISTPSDSACHSNTTSSNCRNTTLSVRVKPNQNPWRYNYLTSFSYVIQKMSITDNEYGLKLDSNSHMIKNMEWGAVAYLTHSGYGRCSGDGCEEVALNSYYVFSSEELMTGCGPQSEDSEDSGEICNSYNTKLGQLASTTGNIYGVYDMSGGAVDYVMGNMSSATGSYTYNANAAASTGSSNFTYSSDTAKYIDTYAFYNTSSGQTSYNRARLGDATSEVLNTSDGSSVVAYGWYNAVSSYPISSYAWFARGGFYNTNPGVFAFSYTNGYYLEHNSTHATLISLE